MNFICEKIQKVLVVLTYNTTKLQLAKNCKSIKYLLKNAFGSFNFTLQQNAVLLVHITTIKFCKFAR